jgi:hypothetical protein
MKRLIIIFLTIAVTAACSNTEPSSPQRQYRFTGEVFSNVSQKGQEADGLKILYDLTVTGFDPQGKEFEKFRNQFLHERDGGIITISPRTKVFKVSGETRTELHPSQLQRGQKLEFWLSIYEKDNGYLEAEEINVLE